MFIEVHVGARDFRTHSKTKKLWARGVLGGAEGDAVERQHASARGEGRTAVFRTPGAPALAPVCASVHPTAHRAGVPSGRGPGGANAED